MCMAPAHHLAGFATGAALAVSTHQPAWVAVTSASLASLTAGGITSPDVDQYRAWRTLDRWLPDELLGEGGPLQHRGLSHWWGLPAAVGAALYLSGGPWWAWMLLAGWVSHLVADFVFGRGWGGREAGIPAWPWWGHIGLGGDAGGLLERWILVPVLTVAGPAILAWPYLGPLVRTATTAWEATR
jgi:hypothetical protein